MSLKSLSLTLAMWATDAVARIVAVVTLDKVNTALATIIAALSIVHLIIKIRKESREK